MKKKLSLLLVICMLISVMAPLPTAYASEKPTVTVRFVDTGETISDGDESLPVWKMVVGTGASAGGVQVINTVFSMDKSVIKPVKDPDGEGNYSFSPMGEESLVCIGKYGNGVTHFYSPTPEQWLENTDNNTMAFSYGAYTNATINASYYNVESMYEFYFAIAGDPYKGCIKLETQSGEGSYINRFYSDPKEQNGILVKSNGVEYVYTASNKSDINYSINYSSNMSDKVSSIAITTPPSKTDYVEGESFSRTGMEVTATYADDTTQVITQYDVTPAGELNPAHDKVTVSYTDPFDNVVYTDTQAISVTPKVIDNISASFSQGDTKVYTSNTLDTLKSYLNVTANYNDNTTAAIAADDYTLSGDLAGDGSSGSRTITVTHTASGKTATFVVNVTKVEVISINVVFNQGDSIIYEGTLLDNLKSMLTVTGTNNDGTSAGDVKNDCTLNGNLVAGTSTITVTHTLSGLTDTFTVNVTEASVISIAVKTPPTKTSYKAYEEFDPTGMTIIVNYSNGTSSTETVIKSMVSYVEETNRSLRVSDTYVVINFGGKTTSTPVNVTKAQIMKPTVDDSGLIYNGSDQSPIIAVNAAYTISDNLQKNAGSYQAKVVLNDKDNAEWSDGTATDLSLDWSIEAKTITAANGTYTISKVYDGTTSAGAEKNSLALEGVVGTDAVSVIVDAVPDYPNANVGTYSLTLDISLSGDSAGNYKLDSETYIFDGAAITPATITGFNTEAPVAAILANDEKNTDAATLKTAISLPANVTINYAAGTAVLPIEWADAVEPFNIKGGVYTYKGTVVNGTNFNAYATALDAVLTVTPVKITGISAVPGTLTLAKVTVQGADTLTEIGLPAQITLSFDNSAADQVVTAAWDTTLEQLQALADTVTTTDQFKRVTLTNTNFPEWATMDQTFPGTDVTITNKLVIPEEDITFADAEITYGDTLNQEATVIEISYPDATVSYSYTGTGTTVYGPSAIPPVDAGTYTVTATVETDTHKGTKSANLTINPKSLGSVTISTIEAQNYTGNAITPSYTVTGDSRTLVADTDYTGIFTNNINAGTATLTITCKGNYIGTANTTFSILKADPSITFSNTSQTLTSAGNNITPVVATLTPASAGASVTVYYYVLVTPKAECTVVHETTCASITSGNIEDCDCIENHTAHDGDCGYVAADEYGWVTTVPQKAGTYKIYAYTAGDANLNAVNTAAPVADTVTDTLIINPYVASGGGGGGGGGSTATPPATVNPPVTSGTTTTVTTTVVPTTTGSTSKATVSSTVLNEAVNSAVKAAVEAGSKANVTIKVETPAAASSVQVTLPKASVSNLINQDDKATMTVESGIGIITFDSEALSAIQKGAAGNDIVVVVSNVEKNALNSEQQAIVGDRPVIDLSVMSGANAISDFNGGSATVSIPYTLAEGEEPEGIVIWYLADDGTLERKECTYDSATKQITFAADHFSKYVAAYFPFTDLKGGEWYYENAVYAYTNDLIKGVKNDKFDPLGETTRAMVTTILWRLEGQPAASGNTFKDVADDTWYTDAISWAAEKGIVSGYSSDQFGPNDTITREQMATIIYNFGTFKKYNMEGKADLTVFGDVNNISDWAETSVQWAVENKIISGIGNSKLDPNGSAQRAQVAAILQRFIESNK